MGVKVFAPASVANLAVGFDTLGLCLEHPGDEIIGELSDQPGVTIESISGAGGRLPKDPKLNTAGLAAQALLDAYGQPEIGVTLRIHKKMPFGSGMGSSSASAVAGAMVVNELLKRPYDKRQLLQFAGVGEQGADGAWHLDNVAPSMMGGIVLVRDAATCDVHRLICPPGLRIALVHPKLEILTKDARSILKDSVPLSAMIQQQANLAGFIVGLYRNDQELIKRSLRDVVIEPQRSQLIPGFKEVQAAAMEAKAMGCSISGAGPSVFALCQNQLIAEECGKAMQAAFAKTGIESEVYLSGIDPEGARLC